MTESELQRLVCDLATLRGWSWYHTYDSRRSNAGFPDLVLRRGPRLVFAELKSAKGVVSPAQADWLDGLRRTGVEVYVWRPVDWDNGTIDRLLA